ncbi:MAG TPA: hypothetical protein VNB49_00840 [Candidatus Dormibacteraeota bacterium]|nr:hypothetical protein [Candidatus Dormibacteraeota bacterium]
MNPGKIRLLKEARQLLWPWLAVTLGGFLSFIQIPPGKWHWSPGDVVQWILPLGTFLGVPFLATLPLGMEFQHRTFALLLAQPIERSELWRTKIFVTTAAVLPPAFIYGMSGRMSQDIGPELRTMAAAWIVATAAGAMVWTLIARSTMNGLWLNVAMNGSLFFAWGYLAEHQRKHGALSSVFLGTTAAVLLCYPAGMVWLGRRMLLRRQVVEGMQAGEARVPGARYLPEAVADWFRCRPTGAVLNVVRREFRLLRSVWALAPLSVAAWILLVVSGFPPVNPSPSEGRFLMLVLAIVLSVLMALLAGTLSLGEEKTWGTHALQLTLPLSISAQWLVKLLVALFTSVVCAAALPISVLMVSGWLSGAPLRYFGDTPLWFFPLAVVIVTLIAFWCSCATQGTVRTVVWFYVVLFGLGFAILSGPWLGERVSYARGLFDIAVTRLDPIRVYRVVSVIVGAGLKNRDIWNDVLLVSTTPLLVVVGLMQSRRLFRLPIEETALRIARLVLPLLLICLLPSLVLAGFFQFAFRFYRQQETLLRETHNAIEAIQLGRASQERTRPQRLTMGDLEKASPLSSRTQKWLRNSTILVVQDQARQSVNGLPHIEWPYEMRFLIRRPQGKNVLAYTATISLASGAECSLRFVLASSLHVHPPGGEHQYDGLLDAMCQ